MVSSRFTEAAASFEEATGGVHLPLQLRLSRFYQSWLRNVAIFINFWWLFDGFSMDSRRFQWHFDQI